MREGEVKGRTHTATDKRKEGGEEGGGLATIREGGGR